MCALGMSGPPAGARPRPEPALVQAPPGGQTSPEQEARRRTLPALGNANSNSTMIAVTGIDITGSSILYLVDTVNRQLAVYQANGGSDSTQGVKLVGARKIDLDLQLLGFNDKSEYSYKELEKQFSDRDKKPAADK